MKHDQPVTFTLPLWVCRELLLRFRPSDPVFRAIEAGMRLHETANQGTAGVPVVAWRIPKEGKVR